MKKLFAAAMAAMMISSPALAGKDPCKGVKQKKNAFGVARTYEKGDFKITKAGDAWSMLVGFNTGGGYGGFSAQNATPLPAGTVLEVMMEDGSILKLESAGSAGPQFIAIMGVMVTHFDMPVSPTAEQVSTLAAQPIKAFRVMQGNEEFYAGEVKKGDAGKLQETLTCMVGT